MFFFILSTRPNKHLFDPSAYARSAVGAGNQGRGVVPGDRIEGGAVPFEGQIGGQEGEAAMDGNHRATRR